MSYSGPKNFALLAPGAEEIRKKIDALIDQNATLDEMAVIARGTCTRSSLGRYRSWRRRNKHKGDGLVFTGGRVEVIWPDDDLATVERKINVADWIVVVEWETGEIRNPYALLSDEQRAAVAAEEAAQRGAAMQEQLATAAAGARAGQIPPEIPPRK